MKVRQTMHCESLRLRKKSTECAMIQPVVLLFLIKIRPRRIDKKSNVKKINKLKCDLWESFKAGCIFTKIACQINETQDVCTCIKNERLYETVYSKIYIGHNYSILYIKKLDQFVKLLKSTCNLNF